MCSRASVFLLCVFVGCAANVTAVDGGSGPDGGGGSDSGQGTDAGGTTDSGSPTDSGTPGDAGYTFLDTGCPIFAPDYAYNVDVSGLMPDPSSPAIISWLQADAGPMAAEFPGDEFYNIVPASQPLVPVDAGSIFGFLPDGGFFYDTPAQLAVATAPIPPNPIFECQGQPNCDHHFMILQTGSCQLFELYAYNPLSATTGWEILVQWQLDGSPQIPGALQIGSTTQAGTPLLPGVIWPDEVATGELHHAIDIVSPDTAITPCTYVHPASTVRYVGADQAAPYGTRFRLKSTYDTSQYTGTQALVVIRALQKYGMFITDGSGETRSAFRLGQNPDGGTLNQADISQLNQLQWKDFDVMPLGTIYRDCAG